MLLLSFVLYIAINVVISDQSYPLPRGAQVRVTRSGMQYGASIAVRKLQRELTNKIIDSQSGRSGDVYYSASNIIIHYIRVGRYSVAPLANVGLRLSVGDIAVSAQGKVNVQYRKGWFKVGDTTNVRINGKGIAFNVDVKIGAANGKPTLSAISCSTGISDLDLNFSGGLSWLYNMFSSVLEGKLKDVLRNLMCNQGRGMFNKEANQFLSAFPVRQNIENWAIIDYSFEQPVVSTNFIDLLLRGEFLNRQKPVPGPLTPPSFDTSTASTKMAYVWISSYTLNTAANVFHEAGLLKNLISPTTKGLIPAGVKPFLNTKSFEQIIPELYKTYPDMPIEFALETFEPPTFEISAGKVNVNIYVKANIVVVPPSGKNVPVFYLKISVNTAGSVYVTSVNNQLKVGGNVADFSFTATVGGSIIGAVNIPLDNKSIKDLVRGLVIDQANPVLNKGFPTPNIKDLSFKNPQVTFVQDAVRVDADFVYSG